MNKYLRSNNLVLNLVEESDAKFILELRQNGNLNKHIHSTDVSVEKQKEWIRNYKEKENKGEEFYFRIDTKQGEQLGFVRIYAIDYDKKEFTWGSWIMKEGRPKFAALESALIIYEYAFEVLEMEKSVFDVRKENIGVIAFHERLGAIKTGESDIDNYYEFPKTVYYKGREEKYFAYIQDREEQILTKEK